MIQEGHAGWATFKHFKWTFSLSQASISQVALNFVYFKEIQHLLMEHFNYCWQVGNWYNLVVTTDNALKTESHNPIQLECQKTYYVLRLSSKKAQFRMI